MEDLQLQKTIHQPVSLNGVGLHTGRKVSLTMRPAEPYAGIRFCRIDLPGRPMIPATIETVLDRPRRTSIGIQEAGAEVQTVEHLLAAVSSLGIDNLTIEIDGEEVPGLDGSALSFVGALRDAGLQTLNAPRRWFVVREPLYVQSPDACLAILPYPGFKVSYTMSYDHPQLASQYLSVDVASETFTREVAPARTFCLEHEVRELVRQGMGKGADYENTLVFGPRGPIKNTLRFVDEPVRHKMLDLIGDLTLLGRPIRGHVVSIKSGHSLNISLLRKIRRQEERMRWAGQEVSPMTKSYAGQELDILAIQKILPHRYPFLFVDRILELDEKRCVGLKNVSMDEYYFQGHFPGRPVMPGVLIVEALAQVGGVWMLSKPENAGKLAFFMSIDRVKFRKPVVPGDQLILEVETLRIKSRTGTCRGRAMVDGRVVAECNLMFTVLDA